MKKMRLKIFIIIVVVLLAYSATMLAEKGWNKSDEAEVASEDRTEINPEKDKKAEDFEQDQSEVNVPEKDNNAQEIQNNDPIEEKPAHSKKLDTLMLDKLDNTKYSWWIKLNSEHKTPEIPVSAKKITDQYDGIFIGDVSQKHIYLTFDEGYENGYTPKILDVLKENDVKAIFFVTGPYIEKNPDLIKRMLQEGHKVGNHTINHPSLPGVGYEKFEKEIRGLEEKFIELYGEGFEYMRPPMGEYSERVLAAAKQLGYKTVFWSFAYDDWYTDKIRGAEYAYDKVMSNLHNGAVLLLHAVSKDNAEALDSIIKGIRAEGYEIRPFDL
jgi:peptidoglycan-N-acetylmuramic acid deacetylase